MFLAYNVNTFECICGVCEMNVSTCVVGKVTSRKIATTTDVLPRTTLIRSMYIVAYPHSRMNSVYQNIVYLKNANLSSTIKTENQNAGR